MRPNQTTEVLTPEGTASTASTPCQTPTGNHRNENTSQSSNSPECIGQTLLLTLNTPGSSQTVINQTFINQTFNTNAPSDINTGNKNSSAHQSSFGGPSSSSVNDSNIDVSSSSNTTPAPNDIPASQHIPCPSPAETDPRNQTTPSSSFASQDSRDEDHSPRIEMNQMPAVTENKDKKTKKQKRTPGKSLPQDFQKYAKLDLIKRGYLKSTKPHLLLQTVEFEVYHGRQRKAKLALKNALECWKTHSRPSSEEILKLANQCAESNSLLRAVLFHILSAVKMKAEGVENGEYYFLLSGRIYDVWCLQQKMRKVRQRPDMDNGVHYKQVAEFVPYLMSQIYDLGCDEASAKCKSYALSWIAVAYSHIADYKNAFRFGEKGREIMNAEFPQIKERRKKQSYSRLLECVGLGYEHWKRQFPEALEIFEESVVATRMAKYDDESKRETALSIRSRYVQRVQKKITSQ